MSEKPTIIIGSPNDSKSVGDNSSNGGVKQQGAWVNLLRSHGYDAYFVTFDGSQVQWLVKHPPVVSIETVKQWKAEGRPLKGVTTWMWSAAFFDVFEHYYLFDEELAYTGRYDRQRGLLEAHLAGGRITKVAVTNKFAQGWYAALYDRPTTLIHEFSDSSVFCPDDEERVTYRVGFTDEGESTAAVIRAVQLACDANVPAWVTFMQISGSEREFAEKLRTCDLFLVTNPSKWAWGEGWTLPGMEAMHSGAVVVAYDVIGNREYTLDGYNGFVVPQGDVLAMADRVVEVLTRDDHKEYVRQNSLSYARQVLVPEARWPVIRDFLDLTD